MKVEYFDIVEKRILVGEVIATNYQQAMLLPRSTEGGKIIPLKEIPGAFKFLILLSTGKFADVWAEQCRLVTGEIPATGAR